MTAQAISAQGLFDRASFWLSVLEVFANVNKIQREKLWDKKSNRSYPDKYRWQADTLEEWGMAAERKTVWLATHISMRVHSKQQYFG